MKNIVSILFFVLLLIFVFVPPALGQETHPVPPPSEVLEAVVVKITEEKPIEVMENKQIYQKIELKVTKGSNKGQTLSLENGSIPVVNQNLYKLGDKVIVTASKDFEGNDTYTITDYVRRDALLKLLIIFLVLVFVIARWRGIASLFGMGVSFAVIFLYILPQIYKGADPVITAILGSLVIIPTTFYLSHGLNKKTTLAIVGTVIALIITGSLAHLFIEAAKLTGFTSEEAGFLQNIKPGVINIKGLLLAGTIIGALGVLDDITVAQAAIVQQLKETASTLTFRELYSKAMKVGQDHIASMVNTLILVYTGAALPLLLLFINNPRPFSELINYEMIADEIVRTLVGSIGLILAVPVTTFLAAIALNADQFIELNEKPGSTQVQPLLNPEVKDNEKRYFKKTK